MILISGKHNTESTYSILKISNATEKFLRDVMKLVPEESDEMRNEYQRMLAKINSCFKKSLNFVLNDGCNAMYSPTLTGLTSW